MVFTEGIDGLDLEKTGPLFENHPLFPDRINTEFMDNIDDLDLEKIGPHFENHELFPNRINTEFIEVIDDHTLNMRVWERGSGETFACGTGACASAVAAVLNGHCKRDEEILIHLRGGDLRITYKSDETVMMTGPAEFICDGTVKNEYIDEMKENAVCRS